MSPLFKFQTNTTVLLKNISLLKIRVNIAVGRCRKHCCCIYRTKQKLVLKYLINKVSLHYLPINH